MVCFLSGKIAVCAEEMEMFYTIQKVEVYEKEDTSSKVLFTVEEDIPILILGKGDEWCKVQYKEVVGYMHTVFLVWVFLIQLK